MDFDISCKNSKYVHINIFLKDLNLGYKSCVALVLEKIHTQSTKDCLRLISSYPIPAMHLRE